MIGLDRQVYYRAKKSHCAYQQLALQVVDLVRDVRKRMARLGGRKLYEVLYEPLRALGVGRDRLFAILKANKLLITPKRSYHVTTDSHHRFRKHKNLIEDLTIERPEQVFVADITYIGSRQYPLYLALLTDAYSKKIMGFNVSQSLNAAGAIAALRMALKKRVYKNEALIHHSDRGVQYCGQDYQNLLASQRINCSMTEKYDPYQNAVAERVNGILKQEFIQGLLIKDIKLMKKFIAEAIQIYNQERPHLSCQMKTPEQMHQQRTIRIKTYKTKKSTEETSVLSN